MGRLDITTLYGHDNQQPLVQIVLDPPVAQLTPEQTFEVVLKLLEASQSTLTDGFLIEWARSHDFGEHAAWGLMNEFRQWREARVGGRVETARKLGIPIADEQPVVVARPEITDHRFRGDAIGLCSFIVHAEGGGGGKLVCGKPLVEHVRNASRGAQPQTNGGG